MARRLKRNLNFTGREKIPAGEIRILLEEAEQNVTATVYSVGIGPLKRRLDKRPELAAGLVVLEAHRVSASAYDRKELGTVRELADKDEPIDKWPLQHFADAVGVVFNVKIIDHHTSRLLAEAVNVPPTLPDEESVKALLKAMKADIGQQVWRLSFESEGPVILVNKRLDFAKQLLESDRLISAVTVPEILRTVARWMIEHPEERDDAEWAEKWMKFIRSVARNPEMPRWDSDECDASKRDEWIEQLVEDYCFKQRLADMADREHRDRLHGDD